MASGIVFDIQRFSLHDGPGIRTTVFLKGCPLHCLWCHNPESWRPNPQLRFHQDRCTHCGRCALACPSQVHDVATDQHALRYDRCIACGRCVLACANGALELSGRLMDVDAVMAEVLADQTYYRNSGGGLTVSGGEPLLQYDFLVQLLRAGHAHGIHTCVETSGFARQEKVMGLLGLVDEFLFDIKLIDDARHIACTGVSNKPILENLDALLTHGAAVRLRCPIIPGINDTDAHISGVSALTHRYPNLLGVDVLPYHSIGRNKWKQIGRDYSLSDLETLGQSDQECLLQRFQAFGCVHAVLHSTTS